MPEMGPLIPHIGHLRPVYGPLGFKTPEWSLSLSLSLSLSQNWDVPCVTRIGLLYEVNPLGMKRPFSYLRMRLTNLRPEINSLRYGINPP